MTDIPATCNDGAAAAVAPLATTTADDVAAGIDYRRVTRLAMYPREQLFLVHLDDGMTRSTEREAYYALLRTIEHDPARRLVPVQAGFYDCIVRVEMCEQAADEAGHGHQ